MKTFNIKAYKGGSIIGTNIEIPYDVVFWGEKSTVFNNGVDYTTVVESLKYKEWIDDIINNPITRIDDIGKYSVITLVAINVSQSDCIPSIPTNDRHQYFKNNGIRLSEYTFAKYYEDKLIYVQKIIDFINMNNVDVATINIKNFAENKEISMKRQKNVPWNPDYHIRTLDGNDANILWSTSIYSVSHYFFPDDYWVSSWLLEDLKDEDWNIKSSVYNNGI